MSDYQLIGFGVLRREDRAIIPDDSLNKDWLAYKEWLKTGGVPLPLVEPDERAESERFWRDAELGAVTWLRERHRDEVELGGATSLTVEHYGELLGYMQSLRDWPQASDFPDAKQRPIRPAWIDRQTQ